MFSIPDKAYTKFNHPNSSVQYISCFQQIIRRTYILRSIQNLTQNVYTCCGLIWLLRHVTYGMMNAIINTFSTVGIQIFNSNSSGVSELETNENVDRNSTIFAIPLGNSLLHYYDISSSKYNKYTVIYSCRFYSMYVGFKMLYSIFDPNNLSRDVKVRIISTKIWIIF